jgi:hypothetical protein
MVPVMKGGLKVPLFRHRQVDLPVLPQTNAYAMVRRGAAAAGIEVSLDEVEGSRPEAIPPPAGILHLVLQHVTL